METVISTLHAQSEGLLPGYLTGSRQISIDLYLQYLVKEIPALSMPDVCTNQPAPGKAFCTEHSQLLESQSPPIPTELRSFLKYCGIIKGKVTKKFAKRKQAHVGMKSSKTNQTRRERHHNTFTPSLHLVPFCQNCVFVFVF